MRKFILIVTASFFAAVLTRPAFAGEWNKARDVEVDKELAGMQIASSILPPGKYGDSNINPKQGKIAGLGLSDAGAAAGATAKGGGADLGGANTGASDNAGIGAGVEAPPLDAGTDLTEEPTVGGDVSGGGEDYLISVDASVGETDVSADLIPADSFDDTLVSEIADIGAEIDASADLTGSEAEIGVEADLDGTVSGDDIGSDPADGLPATPSL